MINFYRIQHDLVNSLRSLTFRMIRPLVICFFVLCCSASHTPASEFQEYRIKAAFLYNFANFVEWPPGSFQDNTTAIVIGILGQNELLEALKAANLKPIRSRRVVTKACEDLKDMDDCHMLFVDRSSADNLQRILDRARAKSILTVSDMDMFTTKGGIINFVEKGNQLRFVINLQAATLSKLRISSKLLNLATTVLGSSSEGND